MTGWTGNAAMNMWVVADSTLESEPEVIGNIYENPELLNPSTAPSSP